jgi:Mg2+/Co2+ transporter CorB
MAWRWQHYHDAAGVGVCRSAAKTYAITTRTRRQRRRPIGIIVTVFAPMVAAVRMLVRGVSACLAFRRTPTAQHLVMKSRGVAVRPFEGVVEKKTATDFGRADLAARTVEEVMLHRKEIEMIDAALPVAEILRLCLDSNHTGCRCIAMSRKISSERCTPKTCSRVLHKML